MDIQKLEAEIDTLEKEKQNLKENQSMAAVQLEDKLVSLSQVNSEIEQENETLRKQMRELDAKINRQEELVAKSNAVLFEKLSKG
jgi:cell division protein FtsB